MVVLREYGEALNIINDKNTFMKAEWFLRGIKILSYSISYYSMTSALNISKQDLYIHLVASEMIRLTITIPRYNKF